MAEAKRALDRVSELYSVHFDIVDKDFGGIAIDRHGDPFPQDTRDCCAASDAVLLAAVGGPKWDATPVGSPKPEQGLLGLRKAMGAFANLRPVRTFDALASASTLKFEVVQGIDLIIVRELIGGIYFGKRAIERDVEGAGIGGGRGSYAFDTMEYSEYEIDRIARRAFELASNRRCKVTSVDKANVLDSSKLWREVVHEVARDYPDVELDDMLVDNAAMQLVRNPSSFDVILTENSFGDILSDEASMLTGSLGMLASASIGDGTPVFEPCHGSAPDIAGRGIANPCAMILSTAMMLSIAFGLHDAAKSIEDAVEEALRAGYRTPDIAGEDTDESLIIGTAEMGERILELMR